MKDKILACIIMVILILGIIINTVLITKGIDKTISSVEDLNILSESYTMLSDAEKVYGSFKKKESFISLTVNHSDLTNIEGLFSEMIGYISVGNTKDAEVTKNRLIDSLEHLRRLSGFNIDSII